MVASRAELASVLLARLSETTASISLSAPNNFGKSALLRQVVANHLEATTRQSSLLKLVYVDFNLRADDSVQAFYEVILRAIHHTEAQPHYRTNPALGSPTGGDQLYQRLVTGQTSFEQAQAFLAALENRLEQLKLVGGRLALLLDEFDSPLTVLAGTVFRHLRALKDHYPNQLIYLFATNLPILTFDNQPEETERDRAEFFELFEAANMLRLGGLTHTETVRLIEDLIGVRAPAEVNYIYRTSGGHPGLTHLVAQLVKEASPISETDWDDLNYRLRTNLSLERECARLWYSLAAEEQTALLHWLEGIRSEDTLSPLGSLLERGLLSETAPDQPIIFSQAFQFYVERQLQNITPAIAITTSSEPIPNTPTPALSYDPHHEIVVFKQDNRRQLLTGNSATLFKYLWLRQSVPYCTKDELITAVWGQGNAYGTENLDRLVSDLRQLLGDVNKQIIRTIPRHGLKMVGVAETEIRN